ncbi:MAG: thiol oxidoreductase [Luteitalea sp.]|nr:thiol oxidoreductase [Luteitalea sp.]
MTRIRLVACLALAAIVATATGVAQTPIGREVAIARHLQDDEEFAMPLARLIQFGEQLFRANWTIQEGAGRPLVKGTGAPLEDPSRPLVFPRNFNRVSAPDANSCAGCHNAPFGVAGGGGDIVANVFVLGQRFDFASFDTSDPTATGSSVDESGTQTTLQSIANSRATLGMFGAGFIEMLARQMSTDLQRIRDATPPGGRQPLESKGVSFGVIARTAEGAWDATGVEGLPAASLATTGPNDPPSLLIRPFHQAGNVVSLRQFTVNAFTHHHGIQATERVGQDVDPDGDGVVNELTRADVTAATIFQATMAVPGRVIPRDRAIEAAIMLGEQRFETIGCATCHRPSLPLDNEGWIFTEPNPFNPDDTLRLGEASTLAVNLTDLRLPQPRLRAVRGVVHVPAYTDLKLHDICDDPDDPNIEPLDMNQPHGSPGFFEGNRKFLTRKLWGVANEPPYFHHGQYTTLREAVLAHGGEADGSRALFKTLPPAEQDAVIEFLKSLQVLPPGTLFPVVDEHGLPRYWPTEPLGIRASRRQDHTGSP